MHTARFPYSLLRVLAYRVPFIYNLGWMWFIVKSWSKIVLSPEWIVVSGLVVVLSYKVVSLAVRLVRYIYLNFLSFSLWDQWFPNQRLHLLNWLVANVATAMVLHVILFFFLVLNNNVLINDMAPEVNIRQGCKHDVNWNPNLPRLDQVGVLRLF